MLKGPMPGADGPEQTGSGDGGKSQPEGDGLTMCSAHWAVGTREGRRQGGRHSE